MYRQSVEHGRHLFLRLGGYALAQAAKKKNKSKQNTMLWCELYDMRDEKKN